MKTENVKNLHRYMTKDDRDNIIRICGAEGLLEKIIGEMAKNQRPREWIRNLRTAKTFIGKANDLIAQECSDEDLKKTWARMKKHEIVIVPNDSLKRELQSKAIYPLTEEVWADLTESVLDAKCTGCRIVDHGSCKTRAALQAAGVPPYEDPVPEDRCQYMIDK